MIFVKLCTFKGGGLVPLIPPPGCASVVTYASRSKLLHFISYSVHANLSKYTTTVQYIILNLSPWVYCFFNQLHNDEYTKV